MLSENVQPMTDHASSASIQESVLTFLLSSPTPERIIDFHASELVQAHLCYLLDANREGILSWRTAPNWIKPVR